MPYHVGEKGSYGCSGYPAVKDDGEVMGCHNTREEAAAQIYAINQSEEKSQINNSNVGIKNPDDWPTKKSLTDQNGMPSATGQPHAASNKDFVTPVPKQKTGDTSMSDEVEKACWEGYVQRGMKEKDGRMVPNCVPAESKYDLWEDSDDVYYDGESPLSKAEGYSPPAGARSAARRAIKFKEDGKATGAGTAVGWTRARQLANGESLSLSTVKRMYSYFSRHEVDKKGKDWGNSANPSNGYIMWLAWGGDAGYSWSRKIVESEKNKALFAEIFKAPTNMPSRGYVDWFLRDKD